MALGGGIMPRPLPNTAPDEPPALDPGVPLSPDVSLNPVWPVETGTPPDVDVPSDPLLGPGVAPNTHNKSQYMCHTFDPTHQPCVQAHSPPFHLY